MADRVEYLPNIHNRRVYVSQKTHTGSEGEAMCRLCGKAAESVAHILSRCSVLARLSVESTVLRDAA